MEQYGPLALLMAVAVGLGGVLLLVSTAFGPKRPNPIKASPYECGVEPVGDARAKAPVRYYLVALIFVIFDLEAVFIYPWAVSFRGMAHEGLGLFAFLEMLVFLAVLAVGFVYLWSRRALEWE